MGRVIVAPEAQVDAAEIWAYIANDHTEAADRLLARFDVTFQQISEQPRMGKLAAELSRGLRFFPVGSYLIFYRPLADGIEVARLLHGARDLTAELFRS